MKFKKIYQRNASYGGTLNLGVEFQLPDWRLLGHWHSLAMLVLKLSKLMKEYDTLREHHGYLPSIFKIMANTAWSGEMFSFSLQWIRHGREHVSRFCDIFLVKSKLDCKDYIFFYEAHFKCIVFKLQWVKHGQHLEMLTEILSSESATLNSCTPCSFAIHILGKSRSSSTISRTPKISLNKIWFGK